MGFAAAVHPRRARRTAGPPFPAPPGTYPGKEAVADYLRDYAATFELPVELNARVTGLHPHRRRVPARDRGREFTARQVSSRPGPSTCPWSRAGGGTGQLGDPGAQRRLPESADLPDGPVLVVGGGNSGLQIAEELASTRPVELSLGSTYPALPQRLLGRDLFWWLTRLGLMRATVNSRLGRRMQTRGEFLIGSSRRDLQRAGVGFRPRAGHSFRPHGAVRRRQQPGRRRRGLGDRLSVRLLLDRRPGRAARRPGRPPPWRHRRAGAVLPRPAVAAHPRLGPAGLRRRRRSPRGPSRPAAPRCHPVAGTTTHPVPN